ncbi:MAG: site-specific DNA-methyltransferase [candidate division Zixibacteria bacterium]|nr:site-specific DNA-methyltransferase [candidate division Zixibacteria bacterium]
MILRGDALTILPTLPAASVDLVVTDPPFAIEFTGTKPNYNRDHSNVIPGYREVTAADYPTFTRAWMQEAWRILKPDGSMYVVSGWTNLKDILNALDAVGFTTVNHIVWQFQFGVFTRRKYVSSHYHVLYVVKNPRRYTYHLEARHPLAERTATGGSANYADREDVWYIPREFWPGRKKTATKLPEALVEKMLDYSSDPGDTVLDPFFGSGTVGAVARRMGRQWIGIEIVDAYADFAAERLNDNLSYI